MAYCDVSSSNEGMPSNEESPYEAIDIESTHFSSEKQCSRFPNKAATAQENVSPSRYDWSAVQETTGKYAKKKYQKGCCTTASFVACLCLVIAAVSIGVAIACLAYNRLESVSHSDDIQALRSDVRRIQIELNETFLYGLERITEHFKNETSIVNRTLSNSIASNQRSLEEKQMMFVTAIRSCNDIPENTSGKFLMISGSNRVLRQVHCDSTDRNCRCNAI